MANATIPAAVAAPGRVRQSSTPWNTLRRLRVLRAVLLCLSALMLVLLLATGEGIREAANRIEADGNPGLVAAQQIGASLSAMDDAFVSQSLPSTGSQAELDEAYNAHRTEVVRDLIHAAQHISPGGAERQPIEMLEEDLGEYERLLQRSRDLQERDPGAALPVYREAVTVLDTRLLPAANKLSTLNEKALDAGSSAQSFSYTALASLRVLEGLCLLGLLIFSQSFLSRRTHRTLSAPLLAATLLLLIGGVHVGSLLAEAETKLLDAKTETLAASREVLVARAGASAADDLERRAVLDRSQAATWERGLIQSDDLVATLPPDLTGEQLLATLREGHAVDGFSGALAAATQRARNNEEREVALAAVSAWQSYVAAAQQVLRLQHHGQQREALALLTGNSPAGLPSLREHLLHTLDDLLASREAALTQDLAASHRSLRSATLETCVAVPLLGLLIVLGFAPRVREYEIH